MEPKKEDPRLEDSGAKISLVYHSGALGDFVTTVPAIACWRRRHPRDRIVFLTRRAHGDLARLAGLVDSAWDLDESRFSRLFTRDRTVPASMHFERALLFARPDSPLVDAVRATGCPKVTVQAPFPPAPQPIVSYHLSLFAAPPPATELFRPLRILGLAREVISQAGKGEAETVIIHPGSGGQEKSWPGHRFEDVGGILRDGGRRVVWCLGPNEEDYSPPPEDALVREPSLPELCGVLARARFYLGNDSGVSHLAAACGCPCVVLFGPSDERIWAPCGEAVEIVRPRGAVPGVRETDIRKIEIEEVLAAIGRLEGVVRPLRSPFPGDFGPALR